MTTGSWILAAAFIIILITAIISTSLLTRYLQQRRQRAAAHNDALLTPEVPRDEFRGPHPRIIMNPSKHEDIHAFKAHVEAAAAAVGVRHLQWMETTPEDPGTGQAIEAVVSGASVVIAAGGDGTVRAVAAGLAHTGVRMGIIPVGTGNLLARNLGLPTDDLEEAVKVALGPDHRLVDLGWLSVRDIEEPSSLPAEGALALKAWHSHPDLAPTPLPSEDEYSYIVISGMGFDGETMMATDPDLKKKIGWAAYVIAGMSALNVDTLNAHLTTISADGDSTKVDLEAKSIMFANCGELPYLVLAPEATVDDGMMDVIAVDTHAGLVGWADLGLKIFNQGLGLPALNLPSTGEIAFTQARDAALTVHKASPVQVDGDAIGTARSIRTRMDVGALDISVTEI